MKKYEYIEYQELFELIKELAMKEYGDKYGGEQIYWFFEGILDNQCRIDKAIEWVNSHIETYTINEISIIDWDTTSDPRKLLNILRGE